MNEPSAPPVTPPSRRDLAMRSPRAWLLLLAVILLGLALDFSTKMLSFEHVAGVPVHLDRELLLTNPALSPIPPHDGIPVLPWNLLELRLVLNPGAVFGIGPNHRFFFIVFTLIALGGGLFVFGRMTKSRHRLAHVGLGLILAGGLGNLYDRIVIGRVRDFLHMLPDWHLPFGWNWPGGNPEVFPWIFNIADVSLLTGMCLVMLHIHLIERTRKQREQAAAAPV